MEEQCKELRVSVENSVGKIDEQTKRSPVKVSRQKCEVSKNVEVKCKELSDSVDGSRIQIARKRSEWSKNLAEQTKELSVSADGIKNSPSKIRRTRSELIRELSVSVDGMEKSPVRSMRTRDMSQKESKGLGAEIDRSSVQLRKVKSASSKASSVGNESNAALTKTRSEASKDSNVPGNSSEGVSSELSQNPQKLQHRSAFIFGLGTFVIMSSSYTTDLNISVISVVSYVGLIYLAITFLVRSIIQRGVTEEDETDQEYVFGVEEAIWLLKMILPYVNEFLLKARALFSGDPATTMKLAVLLFVLARCGSSITIWKMAKLGFFGAFTVPKICSSYSSQLTAFGTFWIRRIRDAWESCSQKKAVGFFIFTLIWNLSSVVARIWAVFMVFVAFKYYQQSLSDGEDWIKDDAEEEISGKSSSSLVLVEEKKNKSCKQIIGGRMRRQGPGPTLLETKKQKKPIS